MKLLWRYLVLVVLPVFLLQGAPLPDRPVFAHEESDLRPDPKVRYGQLPNGLRYVILANQEPRERVSLRLLVMAGSLHENDEQQGLAHFLEHMAFNGSQHYAPGTLIEFFQRMGMSFGGDTNAHTSFDHTAYLLELPHRDPKTTEEGMRVLADYAGGLLLQAPEIDKERGIILAEKRDRDSVGLREWVAEAGFTLAGTRIPQRIPIGLAEVIEKAPRERFVEFYDSWYRPERLAVVAVGDFNPAEIEQQLQHAFTPLQARGPAPASLETGQVEKRDRPRAFAHHEAESGATRVSIQLIRDGSAKKDTQAERARDLARSLAAQIISRRLEILSRRPDSVFSRGTFGTENVFHTVESASIELTCKPEFWQKALVVAENELRRALQFGFTEAELAEARANVRNSLEEAARTAATRRSDALADQLMETLIQGDVFTTPADDLARLGPVLESLTREQCLDAAREVFSGNAPVITVIGNAKVPGNAEQAEAAILAVLTEAAKLAVTAPAEEKVIPFGYTYFGEEGKYAISRRVEDLDVHLATLGNGVRVNLKKTDFEQGKIRLLLRVGAGQLSQPLDRPGLNLLADFAFFSGGLGKHSFDELQRILAGRTVSLQVRTGTDAFLFIGETNQADLLLNLQLFTAYLTDPGYRPEAFTLVKKQADQFYTRVEHTPEGPLQLEVPRLLADGDTRFGLARRNEVDALTFEDLRAWLTPEFAQGAMELSVVGDLDLEATRKAIAQTIGALPKRAPKPAYTEARKVNFPTVTSRTFPFQSELPKAYVYIAWPTTDNRDINTTRQLNLLANVFSDRLRTRVREELGDAYSPYAMSAPSDAFWGYGTFAAVIAASPDKTDKLTAVTLEIARDLIEKGITDDETERAKQPVLTSIREASRTNPYWLQTVLASAQEMPQRLDWRRSIESGHTAITSAQLQALAKRFLLPQAAFRFATQPTTVALPTPTPLPKLTRPKAAPTPAAPNPAGKRDQRPRGTPTPTPNNDF